MVVISLSLFSHPAWSNGTAAVRGSRVLNGGRHYWEVRVNQRVFGTSLMFGIGTRKAQLYRGSFVNLLGIDRESWGLSHKGLIWHGGESKEFTDSFPENESTTIGLLFDGHKGTLQYFKDGRDLGIAFQGLHMVNKPLHPIIASTAARTEMSLQRPLRPIDTLQDICLSAIARQLKISDDVDQLPMPRSLQSELLQWRSWPPRKPMECRTSVPRRKHCSRRTVARKETRV